MGGSESKRRVIVEDANGEGVVKISEAVVRRVKGLPEATSDQGTANAKFQPRQSTQSRKEEEQYSRLAKSEIETFYSEKMNDLHKRNELLQVQTNEQFATAVQEVEQKFLSYTLSPICQDLQTKVLQCYQANPSETLNCSPMVTAFTTCVERARLSANNLRPHPTAPLVEPVS